MANSTPRALTVLVLALLVFVYLAVQVALGGHLVAVVDPGVTHWLAARRTQTLTRFLTIVTQVHSTAGIDFMLALVAAYVGLMRKEWRTAGWLVLAVESSMVLNVGLKDAFARHRPGVDVPLVHLSTYSFPSGHALATTALWTCVWLLLPAGKPKTCAGFGLAFIVLLVCLSRVYLGAHFLTDVCAGVCEGLFCAAAWSMVLPRTHGPSAAKRADVPAGRGANP